MTKDARVLSAKERELHDHYATNAQARGHAADCALILTPVNWPTLRGRPVCDCQEGEQR